MTLRWLLLLMTALASRGAEPWPDLATVPADLVVPAVEDRAPAPGRRVRMTTPGWSGPAVYHVLYLPTDWRAGRRFPIIFEYAGNGGYRNRYGDVSDGSVDGSRLGYGLTGGAGVIWLCLPFVARDGAATRNATTWWGDPAETNRYAAATLRDVAEKFGGDASRVVLAGFSRGAIAVNFLGLADDAVAATWKGFFCHSHYDGVNERWPYAGADRGAARVRLERLRGRPQWISHEGSVEAVATYLRSTGIAGDFTLRALPFRNHSDAWVLRDIPLRREARAWLQRVLAP